jgi:hypothetical protein
MMTMTIYTGVPISGIYDVLRVSVLKRIVISLIGCITLNHPALSGDVISPYLKPLRSFDLVFIQS